MTSDFEEPFQLSFQADSFHSGSISFGRFEAESLSWERRSSFSHNRYLEEVEKYSKPGSVTEKKAYFEAHFKKRALLSSQSSSECQNGTEYQTSENEDLQNMGNVEEFNNANDSCRFTHFDESPDHGEYDGECELTKCEKEEKGAEPLVEPAINNADVVDSVTEHVKHEEAHQTETENLFLVNTEPETEEGLNHMVHVDVTSKANDPSPSSQTSANGDSASSGYQRIPSPKVRTVSETKPSKPRLKSQANVTQVQRIISTEASKDSTKRSSRKESAGSLRTKQEKKLSQTATPTTRSMGRTSKSENSGSLNGKTVHESRSIEKELRIKKVVESQSLTLEKFVPRAGHAANRPKQTVNSSQLSMKQSAAVFNFKSDERAQRRKEYFMKLEEKIHDKEAEINQIQSKTLEKTEADIKQFRKSLNFKATPMPSFYHESVRGSDINKVVSSSTKSSKTQTKSSSNPRARAAESPSSYSKTENDQALSGSEPANAANSNNPSEAGTNNEETWKKEQEKKNLNSQKHRISEGRKVVKGRRVEGKQKVGHSNDMMTNDMKGVDRGSC